MRAIVVGAGGTTRELLRRLGKLWDVVVVDTDEAKVRAASGIRDVESVVGDGSSALVLGRAGLDRADAVVAATDDDDVNLETIRIAAEAGVLRIIAVAATPERLSEYRARDDVIVISRDGQTSRLIEVQLEPRRVASSAFAEGKAEAIEFSISPDAAVRDKSLRELHSETWIVAAVLREGRLIVPHGDTRLRAGDRVTIVGAAADYSRIVRTFTAGESRFPLGFGKHVAVSLEAPADLEGKVAEAVGLVRNTHAESLLTVTRDISDERDPDKAEETGELIAKLRVRSEGVDLGFRSAQPPLSAALGNLVREESIGALVLNAPGGGELTGLFRVANTVNEYAAAAKPVLLSRGSSPYSSIVVPARRTRAGETAGRAGIDIARSSGAGLVGVAVVSPAFVGDDDLGDARRAAAWLREEAAVQGVPVRRRVRRGNPVRVIEEAADDTSLIVLAMPSLPMSGWRPGITGHLIRRTSASVLLVPQRD